MTVTMHLPSVLRKMTDDEAKVDVDASTVGQAVQALCDKHPDLRKHLLDDEGNVRGFVRIFVDQEDAANMDGVDTPVKDGQVLRVVPAIAGGSYASRRHK